MAKELIILFVKHICLGYVVVSLSPSIYLFLLLSPFLTHPVLLVIIYHVFYSY